MVDWPAHSPDINPIELVWRMLKVKLFSLYLDIIGIGRSEEGWIIFVRV